MSRKSFVHTITGSGGVNNYDAPHRIGDSQLYQGYDVFPGFNGLMAPRPRLVAVDTVDYYGQDIFEDSEGNIYTAEHGGPVSSVSKLRKNGTVVDATIPSTPSSSSDTCPAIHCEFAGAIYYSARAVNGSSKYEFKKYNITAGTTALVSSFDYPIQACKVFSNRLMLTLRGGPDIGTIFISPYNTDTSFTDSIDINEQRQITDMETVNSVLAVSSDKDIYIMSGRSLLSFSIETAIPDFSAYLYSMQVWNNIMFMHNRIDNRLYMWDVYSPPQLIDENIYSETYIFNMDYYSGDESTKGRKYTVTDNMFICCLGNNYCFNLLKFQKDRNPACAVWQFSVTVVYKNLFKTSGANVATGDVGRLGNIYDVDDIQPRIVTKYYDFGQPQQDKRVYRAFITYRGDFWATIKLLFTGERTHEVETTQTFTNPNSFSGIPATAEVTFESTSNFGRFVGVSVIGTPTEDTFWAIESITLEVDTERP